MFSFQESYIMPIMHTFQLLNFNSLPLTEQCIYKCGEWREEVLLVSGFLGGLCHTLNNAVGIFSLETAPQDVCLLD